MSAATVAFVPSAPLLVPAVAGGSADADEELRAACVGVVARAVSGTPDEVVVVASTTSLGGWTEEATWSFAGFGVARPSATDRPLLPWTLGIGAWLLDECGWSGRRRYLGLGPADGNSTGPSVAPGATIVAVGDGTARRSERAPGHIDARAESFDEYVADCLARGDTAGLAGVDPELARDLWCGGVEAWRWVTASLGDQVVTSSELATHVAPYGVGYFAAVWSLG